MKKLSGIITDVKSRYSDMTHVRAGLVGQEVEIVLEESSDHEEVMNATKVFQEGNFVISMQAK
jgi:hypothetical protein